VLHALAVYGGELYAGGDFTTAGGVNTSNLAKWNGSTWSAVGAGVNAEVDALVVWGGELYTGGAFTTAGGAQATNIARWNGTNWSAVSSGVASPVHQVYALAADRGGVYVGGIFAMAGGVPASYIAKWDGSTFASLGTGFDRGVRAMAVSGPDLYVGGWFRIAGDTPANRVAKWDGSSWNALGSGMDGQVNALAVLGNDVYAGGFFTSAGGTPVNNIAKWNGESWSALGSGMQRMNDQSAPVWALVVSGSDIYAGGTFTSAGGTPANNIAKWNGSSWGALGAGTSGEVHALAVCGSDLYAGGYFLRAGGKTANGIARWNGNSWSALGLGLRGRSPFTASGEGLAVFGSDVYVGGDFTAATNLTGSVVVVSNIARWDGSRWSELGQGVNGHVHALAVSEGDLYAAGPFSTAGGVSANHIAKWDGSSWSSLGSGLGPSYRDVDALMAYDGYLYVGGRFTTAGGKVSPYLARASIGRHNQPPVADASATAPVSISANGTNATVALNGTRSSDPDGDLLHYQWFSLPNGEPAVPLAHGVVALVSLPLGEHPMALVVSDGLAAATNAFQVEVITAAEAVRRLMARVERTVRRAQPLLATVSAVLASLERGSPGSAVNQLQAFQHKVQAQVAPMDPALAANLTAEARAIINALNGATMTHGRPHGKLGSLARQPDGGVKMRVSAETAATLILEASTNLCDWEMIGVATNCGDSSLEVYDHRSADFPRRFYRLVTP